MAGKVETFNEALGRLSKNRITDESEKNGVTLETFWQRALRSTLRSHPWNFATYYAQLAADEASPSEASGWTYAYTLPAGGATPRCLRVLLVDQDIHARYDVARRKILTDVTAPLDLKYIGFNDDLNEWPDDALALLALQLAADACMTFTQDRALRDALKLEFKDSKREAKSVDAQEGGEEVLDESELLSSRQ